MLSIKLFSAILFTAVICHETNAMLRFCPRLSAPISKCTLFLPKQQIEQKLLLPIQQAGQQFFLPIQQTHKQLFLPVQQALLLLTATERKTITQKSTFKPLRKKSIPKDIYEKSANLFLTSIKTNNSILSIPDDVIPYLHERIRKSFAKGVEAQEENFKLLSQKFTKALNSGILQLSTMSTDHAHATLVLHYNFATLTLEIMQKKMHPMGYDLDDEDLVEILLSISRKLAQTIIKLINDDRAYDAV